MLKKKESSKIQYQVLTALVLPVYNEYSNLPRLIESLLHNASNSTAIIVVDDSEPKVLSDGYKKNFKIHVLENAKKQGRGSAVRQGIGYCIDNFPNVKRIIEADSDGSHTTNCIEELINLKSDYDLVIGSRYLDQSEIVGWPIYRKFFSSILNKLIPKLIGVNSTDLTNGLRSYSINSARTILQHENKLNGFMNLSETAKIISTHKLTIKEIPTKFVNRTSGRSSITFKDIFKSVLGLLYLINTDGCEKCEF